MLKSHSHSHTLALSHSHTLSISHWITLDMLNNFCFHLYAQNSPSHFLTLTLSLSLSHSHSFSLSHSFNLSFNHSRHAEQVLFSCLGSKVTVYSRKLQWFFLDLTLTTLITLSPDIRVHRAGSQLKSIAIFSNKQWVWSIEMKTKVVQHVPMINISIWHMTCTMWHVTCDMWHNYKYSLLSIDMKTKVVQHVPRINLSISHITCHIAHVTCHM